jgi:hypothetical protein
MTCSAPTHLRLVFDRSYVIAGRSMGRRDYHCITCGISWSLSWGPEW